METSTKNNPRFSDSLGVRGSHLHELLRLDQKLHLARRREESRLCREKMGMQMQNKKEMKLEVGWMNFIETERIYKYVRAPNGGEIRHLNVHRRTSVREVQKMAESLFFPRGRSRSLKLEEHSRCIFDSRQNEIDPECTVKQLYKQTKVKVLRLYLCTKKIDLPTVVKLEPTDDTAESDTLCPPPKWPTDPFFMADSNPHWDREPRNSPAEESVETHDSESDETFESISAPLVLEDTLPWDEPKIKVLLVIRRGDCLCELTEAFSDPDIINKDVHIKRKLPNGQIEEGEHLATFRDCLSEFWGEFYSKCTLGKNVKVPFLKQEFQEEQWQAVARILLVGWKTIEYFPPLLALPFLEKVLYGTFHTDLVNTFLKYVTEEERHILSSALESFDSVDTDELIDVLGDHDCYDFPSKVTIETIVINLAYKTFITTPSPVIDCWKPVLISIADTHPQQLVKIVEERTPTPKRVKENLSLPENMNALQNTVARHLKRYIGECDGYMLHYFLRFCTGADILLGKPITVQFFETSQFLCTPQAYPSESLLMLPIILQNYPELRSVLDLVLKSSVWVRDSQLGLG